MDATTKEDGKRKRESFGGMMTRQEREDRTPKATDDAHLSDEEDDEEEMARKRKAEIEAEKDRERENDGALERWDKK